MEYYSAIKKKEILTFAVTWMDLEGIMLSEISQREKDKHWMLTQKYGNWKDGTGDLTCGAAKETQM